MIKLKSLLDESKILVPRRSVEEREKRWMQEIYRKIQDYIKRGSVGDLDLNYTPIKILPDNLKKVHGNLHLDKSKIEDLNNLEYVGGRFDLRSTPIKKLPDNFKTVDGSLWLENSKIEDLNNLKYVGGDLDLMRAPIKKLPNKLKIIRGHLDLNESEIEDLNNMEYISYDLYLMRTPLSKTTTEEEIRSKIKVGGQIYI